MSACTCPCPECGPDEDPQAIRAAFDAGPKGVTGFSDHPMVHASAMDAAHAQFREAMKAMRVLQADLDAAQNEIEKLLSEKEALREETQRHQVVRERLRVRLSEREAYREFCLESPPSSAWPDVVCARHVDHGGDHGGFPKGPGSTAVPIRWDGGAS